MQQLVGAMSIRSGLAVSPSILAEALPALFVPKFRSSMPSIAQLAKTHPHCLLSPDTRLLRCALTRFLNKNNLNPLSMGQHGPVPWPAIYANRWTTPALDKAGQDSLAPCAVLGCPA